MSDWNDDDIDELLGDPHQDNNTIRTLRAKIKADNAAMKEMRQQLADLSKVRTENVIESALSSAGLNPAYKKFYTGEPDTAKVQSWIDENKDLFGAQAPNTPSPQMPAGPADVGDQPEPAVTPDTQAAMMRMMGMNGVDGMPPSNINDILGAISGASDEEAFKAALRQYGGPSY